MQTFLSALGVAASLFTSDIQDARMCREIGFNNWHKVIYEKGVAKKVECYDKAWKKKEIIITSQ